MITTKRRAQLRALANGLETIFQLGKAGLGPAFEKQVDEALAARELIKIKVLETADVTPGQAASALSAALGADVVQVIGRKFTLYRENPELRKEAAKKPAPKKSVSEKSAFGKPGSQKSNFRKSASNNSAKKSPERKKPAHEQREPAKDRGARRLVRPGAQRASQNSPRRGGNPRAVKGPARPRGKSAP